MNNKIILYALDLTSGATFLAAMATGHITLMILGGLASVMSIINHTDQYLKRKNKKQ